MKRGNPVDRASHLLYRGRSIFAVNEPTAGMPAGKLFERRTAL
jgi:hypothetical protein